MSVVRRFFYVMGPRHEVCHIMYGRSHSEGRTKCGVAVKRGWKWWTTSVLPQMICRNCRSGHGEA